MCKLRLYWVNAIGMVGLVFAMGLSVDPTRPTYPDSLKLPNIDAKKNTVNETLLLKATFVTSDKMLAIINDGIFSVGETVNQEWTLVAVNQDSVTLFNSKEYKTIHLPESQIFGEPNG